MRIVGIVEQPVRLHGGIANALVDFSAHTVSLVAVISDVTRGGKPVTGIAFDSIGRFAQSGILRDRMIPRVLAAAPQTLLAESGRLDPARVLACALTDEKPGGHGDRAAAAAALELACWDLNAKLDDEPAHVNIARQLGRDPSAAGIPVYAAGGYYHAGQPAGSLDALRAEMRQYLDMGYTAVKMKVGGVSLGEDLARVEAVIDVVGAGERVAVDANGRFDQQTAVRWAQALNPYGLRSVRRTWRSTGFRVEPTVDRPLRRRGGRRGKSVLDTGCDQSDPLRRDATRTGHLADGRRPVLWVDRVCRDARGVGGSRFRSTPGVPARRASGEPAYRGGPGAWRL